MIWLLLAACAPTEGGPAVPQSSKVLAPPPAAAASMPTAPVASGPVPPPSFAAPADTKLSTAFVFLGDAGKGSPGQKRTADAVKAWCKEHRCDFVAYLGDNLYPEGAQSAEDPIFKEKFEVYWEGFDGPFWVALGNHDHYGKPEAELAYAKTSKKWKQPAAWYTFSQGVADFYVFDTGKEEEGSIPAEQLAWFTEQTSGAPAQAGAAPWRVAYGHHPIHSSGLHGDGPEMMKVVEPALGKAAVDFWLCGHDHNLEVLDDGQPPVEIVSGAGGDVRKVHPAQPTSKYLASSNGFGYLILEPTKATLAMVEVNAEAAVRVGYHQEWVKP